MARADADSKDILARGWSSAPVVLWFTGTQGRPAAIALVALLALFHIALGERAWSPIRNLLFDAYQLLMPRQVSRYPVVIVDIDDASLAALGRWPWPRTRLARLIEASHRSGALAVGLDIIMPEADSLSPGGLLVDRQDVSPALQKYPRRITLQRCYFGADLAPDSHGDRACGDRRRRSSKRSPE